MNKFFPKSRRRVDLAQRPVTILQVARDAGVSKTSVSRYLGGDFDALSPDLRHAIKRSISKLNFSPNQMARGLKRGRSRLIGMLVTDIRNPYAIAVMRGAEAACQQNGYSLMICNASGGDEEELRHLSAMRSYNVEGLILHTIGHNTQAMRALAESQVPVVLMDRKIAGFDADTVGLDNPGGMQMAMSHLLGQGYRDLLFVSEPIGDSSPRQERHTAFKLYAGAAPGVRSRVCETEVADLTSLTKEIQAFIRDDGHGPKAVFAVNGVVTLAVTRVLRDLGCRLFDDIGLIGIDELDWCALVGTGITTVAQPTYDIGLSATECLLRRLGGDTCAPRHVTYAGKLIVRGSTRILSR